MLHRLLADAENIALWANRRDAQGHLPRLTRRLVHATLERIDRIGFPADEGVQMGGYDGILRVPVGNAFVPDGVSVWEFGTNRAVKAKADGDYGKRLDDPCGVIPSETAYMFVTPRRWGGKDAWVQEKQAEGTWREVRAYDVDDLVAWLELAPGPHLWLSALLGKRPDGVSDLSNFWHEWSGATTPALTAGLIVAWTQEQRGNNLRWRQGEAAAIGLKASSREEALAFFAAILFDLPPEERIPFLARGIVVEDERAWRPLVAQGERLVLVPMFDARDTAVPLAVRAGHHVFVPQGPSDIISGTTIDLRAPEGACPGGLGRRGTAAGARERTGDPGAAQYDGAPPQTRERTRRTPPRLGDGGGSCAPVACPARRFVERGARVRGRPPGTLHARRRALRRFQSRPGALGSGDGAAGAAYRGGLAPRLQGRHGRCSPRSSRGEIWIDSIPSRTELLGEHDPRFELPADERWMAGLHGKVRACSSLLREGLADTLALMAARSGNSPVGGSMTGQDRAGRVVRRLLSEARARDWHAWATLSAGLYPLLAEAAPAAFLDGVEAGCAAASPLWRDSSGKSAETFSSRVRRRPAYCGPWKRSRVAPGVPGAGDLSSRPLRRQLESRSGKPARQ